MSKYSSICFVISPLGPENSEIRRHANKTLEYLIKPAVKKVGLKPLRADEISEFGLITSQVVKYLTNSSVCIADLTGLNPNVMYELGIRHTVLKPVIQIAQRGEKLPFDLINIRTIFYDLSDQDSLKSVQNQITELIKNAHCNQETHLGPFHEFSSNCILDDEKTRKLLTLHQASIAYRMYKVINSTVAQIELNPKSYERDHIFNLIQKATLDSRKICTGFISSSFGDIYSCFEKIYSRQELKEDVRKAQEEILEREDIDSNTKRIMLFELVESSQARVTEIIEKLLNDSKK